MSDFLPEDIVVDILTRLPAKSLIRFRCVSKVWNSLITSPTFISSHITQSLTSNTKISSCNNLSPFIVGQCVSTTHTNTEHYKLLLDNGETFDEYQEIDFPLKSSRLRSFFSLGYVKGLFCLFEQDSHFLWNPSIRKSLMLPRPRIKVKKRSLCTLGFGFDTRTNDHKVVRIVVNEIKQPKEAEVPFVEIYSLSAGLWKMSSGASKSFPLGTNIRYSWHPAACFEGVLHFAAQRNSNDRFILSFDLGDEVFRMISLPNGLERSVREIGISVFGGLLSLLCYDSYVFMSCSIWMMREYGVANSWCKQFKVCLSGSLTRVLGIRNNGHILLAARAQSGWELYSCDPKSQEVKNLRLRIHVGLARSHVDTFEENLILLNKTNDAVSWTGVSRKRKDGSDAESQAQEEELQKIRAEAETLRSELRRQIEEQESQID